MFVMLAMAAGPIVRIGGAEVVRYDGSWWGPLTAFRANGRMAWPALYLLTFLILAGVSRLQPRVASGLLIVGVLAQALDISPLYAATRAVQRARWTTPLADSFWNEVTPHYQRLIALPPNLCAEERAAVAVDPFALLAGDHDVAVNLGTAARFDVMAVRSYCEQVGNQAAAGQFSVDALYVLTPDVAPAVMTRAQVPIVCLSVNKHIVCARRETYGQWQEVREVTAEVLPAGADFVSARADLEEEYARMQRPRAALRGAVEERVAALRMYLIYRVTDCAHDEASNKVIRTTRGELEIRACGNPLTVRRPFPSREEVLIFTRQFDAALAALGRPVLQSTLDPEGEAVWLLEYAKRRAEGESDDAAQDRVRETLRALVRGR